jgi:hypothetical protein
MAMGFITLKQHNMKTNLAFFMLFIFACSSNKQLQSDTSNCDFNDKISESEKIININTYRKQLHKDGFFTLIENDTVENYITINSKGYSKKKLNKITDLLKIINYDTLTLKVTNSFSFYKKGSFTIGNEYIYNDQGQVIKTIDHNHYSKYPICYKEIIQSTIKKAGNKFYFQALERDSLIKNNEKEYSWKVYFASHRSKEFEIIKHKFFRIDAKTGKTITEEIVN